jgi:predicted GIY-YIG superfamily endonuclease
MNCFVYILQSENSGKFYTGISEDPLRRLLFHNSIEKGFTSRYRPWRIVFTKEFPNRSTAQKAEMKIKSWKSKVMINRLINGEVEV